MDDLISRAALIESLKKRAPKPTTDDLYEVNLCIIDAPAVDAAPVVRCRDCKHRPTDNRGRDDDSTGFAIEFPDSRCPCQCEDDWYNWYPDDDWFCADGERRDDDAADTW